ncbi:MAG: hypothetical protein Kow0037_28830 [Calditrichia bacterium]
MSCSGDSQKEQINLQQLKTQLEKGVVPERENPFRERAFKPYLGEQWIGEAVSYGCYREGQAPGVKGPSESEILEDLTLISKYWNLIRVYGSDDDSERILRVIQEHQLPVKVMLGIWLENEDNSPERRRANIRQVVRGIELARRFTEEIIAVNVGNESQVFWSAHRMNMQDLIRYIRAVRKFVRQPVTTADDYNFWNKPESREVAREVDFIVTHMYPLWNGITLPKAIAWTDSIYRVVANSHPAKTVVVGEIGWATNYNPEKKGPGEQGSLIKGEVNLKAQEKFLIQLHKWIHKNRITTFLFEAFDEPWKGGGEQSGPKEIEKNWGVFYENRTPKPSFKEFLRAVNKKEPEK